MLGIIAASSIWAFSFGLIKGLTPQIDPFLLSFLRLSLGLLITLPFFRPGALPLKASGLAALAGFLQLGLMYAPYMLSFQYLKAYEVALFTMTTPIFIGGFALLRRRTRSGPLLTAVVLAVLGGVIVAWRRPESSELTYGICLVQISNLLFAGGQLVWIKAAQHGPASFWRLTPLYFLGAVFGGGLCAIFFASAGWGAVLSLSGRDFGVVAWLGIVSTGLGFLLWNWGALRVTTAQLAVAADLKLPIAVFVSFAFFGEDVDLIRLGLSLLMLFVASYFARTAQLSRSQLAGSD